MFAETFAYETGDMEANAWANGNRGENPCKLLIVFREPFIIRWKSETFLLEMSDLSGAFCWFPSSDITQVQRPQQADMITSPASFSLFGRKERTRKCRQPCGHLLRTCETSSWSETGKNEFFFMRRPMTRFLKQKTVSRTEDFKLMTLDFPFFRQPAICLLWWANYRSPDDVDTVSQNQVSFPFFLKNPFHSFVTIKTEAFILNW